MGLQPAFPLRYGIENPCYTMTYIVFDQVVNIQPGEADSYNGVDKVEIVGSVDGEVVGEQSLYQMNSLFQYECCQCAQQSDKKTQYQDEVLFLDMFFSPNKNFQKPILFHVFLICLSR